MDSTSDSSECAPDSGSWGAVDDSDWDEGDEHSYSLKTKNLRKIAEAINDSFAGHESKKGYFSEGSLDPSNIEVEVDGIGGLKFPITAEVSRKLIEISSLACFGRGDKTLMDKSVRDTYKIPREKIKVTIKEEHEILKKVIHDLQLDEGCELEPQLYNLLIYEEGQFFNFHRDSEKIENMIATLVIVLPSAHIGGGLVIKHSMEKHCFISQTINPTKVKYVAFYADCKHSVEKVQEGYRIALTYNVAIKPSPNTGVTNQFDLSEDLIESVRAHFSAHDILVVLLDHQYTRSNVSWKKLKGRDLKKAKLLISVAKLLDLEINVSLADIQEHWVDSASTGDLDQHSYTKVTLTSFTNIDSKKYESKSVDVDVSDDCLCWTRGNKSHFDSYRSAQEDTGNAGCTEDKWYKRAAIVLCTQKKAKEFEFLYNPELAIENLNHVLNLPDCPKKQAEVKLIMSIDSKYTYVFIQKSIPTFVKLAIYIKNAEKASEIAERAYKFLFVPSKINLLIQLLREYGDIWFRKLLVRVSTKNFSEELLNLAIEFAEHGHVDYGNCILDQQFMLLLTNETVKENQLLKNTSTSIVQKWQCILQAFVKVDRDPLSNAEVAACLNDSKSSFVFLKEALVMHRGLLERSDQLKDIILTKLDTYLQEQTPLAQSWSIDCSLSCHCESGCRNIEQFLKSDTQTRVFKLNNYGRWHVRVTLEKENLPIEITTLMRAQKKTNQGEMEISKTSRLLETRKQNLIYLKTLREKFHLKRDASAVDEVAKKRPI